MKIEINITKKSAIALIIGILVLFFLGYLTYKIDKTYEKTEELFKTSNELLPGETAIGKRAAINWIKGFSPNANIIGVWFLGDGKYIALTKDDESGKSGGSFVFNIENQQTTIECLIGTGTDKYHNYRECYYYKINGSTLVVDTVAFGTTTRNEYDIVHWWPLPDEKS